MNIIHEYVAKVHELVEVPRNELREKVYMKNQTEYIELLEKFEREYFEKCLKIEKMLEEEVAELELRKKERAS